MPHTYVDPDRTFDIIISGAGPAGCVLASRLSEDPTRQVALIDAGPDVTAPGAENPDVLDPFCLAASNNPAFHWPGLVAETGVDVGSGAPRIATPYVQGCGVGGASNINGMGADRGQPGDYDEWCNLGARNWGWNDVLPYFRKVERDLDIATCGASAMHGDVGPMPVQRLPRPRWAPFAAAVGIALEECGFPFIEDYNADFREGFSAVPTNCLPDRRVSASTAYLTPEVRRRGNLAILPNTKIDRVILEDRRATGVIIRAGGVPRRLYGRQVIVSCGAIQSPTLLMRSGLGPREQLARHGIDIVQDLPGVGANLQNHPCVALTTYLRPESLQPPDNRSFLQNWLRFSSPHPGGDRNDMHLMTFNKCDWHQLGRRVGMMVVSVLRSYSKGCVELMSADPDAAPRISFNLLADSRDRERLVKGFRFALEVLCSPVVSKTRREIFLPNEHLVDSLRRRNSWNAFKAQAIASILDLGPLRRVLLAKSRVDPQSLLVDERALRHFVMTQAQPQYHVCGTCRMGRADEREAVVDSVGRVHGIDHLRVVDASIFPTIPRGYTHFIVLMVAEKLSDTIKTEWRATAEGTLPFESSRVS